MRGKLVVGNWKMHGTRAQVESLLTGLMAGEANVSETVAIGVCPSFVHLDLAHTLLRNSRIVLGAQNLSMESEGAFTGEVAAPMLRDLGVTHVIVGHSERRQLFGESDSMVAAKFRQALDHGLTPILCVGESLQQRRQEHTEQVVLAQLDAVIDAAGMEGIARAVIAYEPIWAIGTGETATPAQAQEVHACLRGHMQALDTVTAGQVPILYGGSVKAANAAELFAQADIDGGLVGGASLEATEFLSICKSADS